MYSLTVASLGITYAGIFLIIFVACLAIFGYVGMRPKTTFGPVILAAITLSLLTASFGGVTAAIGLSSDPAPPPSERTTTNKALTLFRDDGAIVEVTHWVAYSVIYLFQIVFIGSYFAVVPLITFYAATSTFVAWGALIAAVYVESVTSRWAFIVIHVAAALFTWVLVGASTRMGWGKVRLYDRTQSEKSHGFSSKILAVGTLILWLLTLLYFILGQAHYAVLGRSTEQILLFVNDIVLLGVVNSLAVWTAWPEAEKPLLD
jgi:hypothetical protein